jgi:hypothetical protein
MNTKSNVIIGILAVAAIVIGVVSYTKTPSTVVGASGAVGPMGPQGPRGEQGIPGRDGVDGITKVVNVPAPTLGGASPDFGPYISVGGVRQWAYSQTFSANASTTCSIAAPAATSSIAWASFQITSNGSSTPAVIGWASAPQATTTKITNSTDIVIAANLGGVVTSSSTAASFLVPPSTRDANGVPVGSYVNFKLGSGGGFTNPVAGTCKVMFVER